MNRRIKETVRNGVQSLTEDTLNAVPGPLVDSWIHGGQSRTLTWREKNVYMIHFNQSIIFIKTFYWKPLQHKVLRMLQVQYTLKREHKNIQKIKETRRIEWNSSKCVTERWRRGDSWRPRMPAVRRCGTDPSQDGPLRQMRVGLMGVQALQLSPECLHSSWGSVIRLQRWFRLRLSRWPSADVTYFCWIAQNQKQTPRPACFLSFDLLVEAAQTSGLPLVSMSLRPRTKADVGFNQKVKQKLHQIWMFLATSWMHLWHWNQCPNVVFLKLRSLFRSKETNKNRKTSAITYKQILFRFSFSSI